MCNIYINLFLKKWKGILGFVFENLIDGKKNYKHFLSCKKAFDTIQHLIAGQHRRTQNFLSKAQYFYNEFVSSLPNPS